MAKSNPIRYRGYYYDRETGLYYLNARYYNPQWRRFISPQTSAINSLVVNGLNTYVYANNNPIEHAELLSKKHGVTATYPNNVLLSLSVHATIHSNDSGGNYWNPHWENKWLDTGWPSFMVLSQSGFEVLNWDLSLYNGSLYFDRDENHSIYIEAGNVDAYIGLHFEEGIGLDAGASVLVIGYDGRIIDASVEGLAVGITYMYKDGKLKWGYGAGWYGWSVSIDFIELFKVFWGGN